jgi:hypothetical protein
MLVTPYIRFDRPVCFTQELASSAPRDRRLNESRIAGFRRSIQHVFDWYRILIIQEVLRALNGDIFDIYENLGE